MKLLVRSLGAKALDVYSHVQLHFEIIGFVSIAELSEGPICVVTMPSSNVVFGCLYQSVKFIAWPRYSCL